MFYFNKVSDFKIKLNTQTWASLILHTVLPQPSFVIEKLLTGTLSLNTTNQVIGTHSMSHVTRKPVLGSCDQVRLKPACSATETN